MKVGKLERLKVGKIDKTFKKILYLVDAASCDGDAARLHTFI